MALRPMLLPFAAVVLALLAQPQSAIAHAKLVASMPKMNDVADSPSEIILTFNEKSDPIFVKLRGSGGQEVAELGSPVVEGVTIKLKVLHKLPVGQYTVEYRVLTDDGHPVSGILSFKVKPVVAE